MNSTPTACRHGSIIVGVDGSATARMAAEAAADMARRYERPLHLVMAVPRVAHEPDRPDVTTTCRRRLGGSDR